ncbi:MAG: hypothetical protein WBI07_03160 [Mobilitalea sp.]
MKRLKKLLIILGFISLLGFLVLFATIRADSYSDRNITIMSNLPGSPGY